MRALTEKAFVQVRDVGGDQLALTAAECVLAAQENLCQLQQRPCGLGPEHHRAADTWHACGQIDVRQRASSLDRRGTVRRRHVAETIASTSAPKNEPTPVETQAAAPEKNRRGLATIIWSICSCVMPASSSAGRIFVRDVQVVGLLVGEHRIADHEVVEARGVVREVDAVGVALGDERGERLDALGVRVEVLDVEAVAAEERAGVGDRRADSRGRCCRRRARSRSATASTPCLASARRARAAPFCAAAFVCTITGAPVSSSPRPRPRRGSAARRR